MPEKDNAPLYYNGTNVSNSLANTPDGEQIVISGIAGRFPESDNMRMFQENLMNKKDLITEDHRRWKFDHPDIPRRGGKVNNIHKFDAVFFGVHAKQTKKMDPMGRILMEHAYEAVMDAGINPRQLQGTKTGVFIGSCYSETENLFVYDKSQTNGFGITGCSRSMLGNRISWWFGIHGPSCTVDTACSSGLYALEHAYSAIKEGRCESAIVGGSNLCLHPSVTLQFARLGLLSPDGCCKVFDDSANGYVRSETIAVVFVQKAKHAKRIYANVIHAKTNCDGFKEQGITFPSSRMQGVLMKEVYEECGIPPTLMNYVEAHGTGTSVGDPEEMAAIEEVFLQGRTEPLLVGSVKSNLGHTEPASGLCSLAKVIIAMESGYIPPNLHFNTPRKGLKSLEDGRIKIVTEPTPWEGGYVGVNSFGFGGANAHVLLKSHTKEKINDGIPDDDLPRLVVISGRTEEAVTIFLNDLESRPVDVEYVRLLHDIHSFDTPGHLYRGYTILPPKGVPTTPIRSCQHYYGAKRPLWFVFSGMGSQWAGMGEALMKLPVFAESVKKCAAALKSYGVDIVDILTNKNPATFDNILNSFVGIATVQVGLVDLLKSVGIVPDNIIGHSVGELGCAYADGCFTAEQMVLAAYARGLASTETELIHGSMAAVGLGYSDLKDLCPSEIEIACHNGPDSSTISGPSDAMKKFVAKLQADNIFAKEVPCSNIAYHSRYIASAGSKLLAYLQEIIPDPKPRSNKWLSTSVPQDKWALTSARLSSAEYHTNNLLKPVLFEETSRLIPSDAITIEIAPHGLLQAILRRSLTQTVSNIAMTRRGHRDNVEVVLQAIGKLYEVGLQPQIHNLYPHVAYPVSRATPMISPLVRWNHSEDWIVKVFEPVKKILIGERTVEVSRTDEDIEYMLGHVIDGRNLLPATGYLVLIWETLSLTKGLTYNELSVVFEDVRFLRATTIPQEGAVELNLIVQQGTGKFAVVEGDTPVVTGIIRTSSNISGERLDITIPTEDTEQTEVMSGRDVYKKLRLRGYQYTGLFRAIRSAGIGNNKGYIAWQNNWGAFMDNILQMKIITTDTEELLVPTAIRKMVIDTQLQYNLLSGNPTQEQELLAYVDPNYDVIRCGGVEIVGLRANSIARRKPRGEPVLEKCAFVAHRDRAEMTLISILRLSMHIALENQQGNKIKTIEVIEESNDVRAEDVVSPHIQDILGDLPLLQADVSIIAPDEKFSPNDIPPTIQINDSKRLAGEEDALLVVTRNLVANKNSDLLQQLSSALKDKGFLIALEPLTGASDSWDMINEKFDIILEKRTDKESVTLLRKKHKPTKITAIIHVNNDEFTWLPKLQEALKTENEVDNMANNRIVLVAEGNFENGLIGLLNCLRKEPGGAHFQGLFIQDLQAEKFSIQNALYNEQLKLDLVHNVLRPGNIWGSYRFLKLDPIKPKPVYHSVLHQANRGDFSSLQWVQGHIHPSLTANDVIKIHYSSLNFRDIMLTSGKLSTDNIKTKTPFVTSFIGFEYAGINMASGRRVMGMTDTEAVANLIAKDDILRWEIPDSWTLEDAATVPVVYATVLSAFYISARIKKGDKILIHAGSGGVGQAAITVALHEGCEVFTTVGTPEKREFIKKMFPQIDDDHIGNSRDTSFEQLIVRQTKGQGVDIVLNSLAEEKLQASIRCLGNKGRFLEIGKFDITANNSLAMETFLKEISFHSIQLDTLFVASAEEQLSLRSLVVSFLQKNVIKPLVRTVFPLDQVEAAFRYMASGKHIGKVLIKHRDEAEVQYSLPRAMPRFYCLPSSSYIVHGGLGGFGLELAHWLIFRGAKKVVLTSRTGITTGYQRGRIHFWRTNGIEVVIVAGKDASTREGCEAILKEAVALGPVDAIFNLAVVLKDSLLENQTAETFEESIRVKAGATKQFDILSRIHCPHLREFVVFSSVSCGRGNAGQTNYGMANSVMERICELRVAESLPALAIEWGAVGDVGLVAEMQEDNKELIIGGTLQQGIRSCLQKLDEFLQQPSPIVSSMVVAEKKSGSAGATNMVDAVANIIGLKDLNAISHHTSLAELGMDSMMGVEIKQTLEREFEVFLTAQDIRTLNFAKIIALSENQAADKKKKTGVHQWAYGEDLAGMKLLVGSLLADKYTKEVCVPLETKQQNDRPEIFILAGIEGCYQVFNHLAAKVKAPTTCLQFTLEMHNLLTIGEMAEYLVPHVKARMKDRKNFTIVGYSFGSLVAIEIVRRLEAAGYTGRLVLIDGAPEFLKTVAIQQLAANDDEQLQLNVILGISDMLAPEVSEQLIVELPKHDTWESKINLFLSKLPDSVESMFSREDQELMCTAFYRRVKAVSNYKLSELLPIKTPITLLRPTNQAIPSKKTDYGLKSITEGKIEVYFVEGNHATILNNRACAAAIDGEPIENLVDEATLNNSIEQRDNISSSVTNGTISDHKENGDRR